MVCLPLIPLVRDTVFLVFVTPPPIASLFFSPYATMSTPITRRTQSIAASLAEEIVCPSRLPAMHVSTRMMEIDITTLSIPLRPSSLHSITTSPTQMSTLHSSFAQAYHPNCLVDYEKLQHKMGHYQMHSHPLPDTHHTTTVHSSWSPSRFHFPQPYDWHHPDPTVPHSTHNHSHFHFPALSTQSIASLAQPPIPLPSFPLHASPPWSPNTDIRETKHAYHIEIELPGVLDKQATTIQWLEGGVLLVRGEAGKREEGEKEDDWCSLSPTHHADELTDGYPLERILTTKEQEATREGLDHHSTAPHTSLSPATTSLHTSPTSTNPPTSMFLLHERHSGLWQRTFTLPLDVDLKGMKASLKAGLLEIICMKRCVDLGGEGRGGRVSVE